MPMLHQTVIDTDAAAKLGKSGAICMGLGKRLHLEWPAIINRITLAMDDRGIGKQQPNQPHLFKIRRHLIGYVRRLL